MRYHSTVAQTTREGHQLHNTLLDLCMVQYGHNSTRLLVSVKLVLQRGLGALDLRATARTSLQLERRWSCMSLPVLVALVACNPSRADKRKTYMDTRAKLSTSWALDVALTASLGNLASPCWRA
eukprot:850812-Amphidinium_carterae.1